MKTMTAREAKNSFGKFLDSAQREAVLVTKHDRPVGVMLSMENLPAILDFADSMRAQIKAGVEAGLADSAAGLSEELNDAYIDKLKQELQLRINAKQNA